MKVTSSLRRSDPQQSNESPVGRSAFIFQKGFVFESLDAHLDYFWEVSGTWKFRGLMLPSLLCMGIGLLIMFRPEFEMFWKCRVFGKFPVGTKASY
jgi:hypothetical protein